MRLHIVGPAPHQLTHGKDSDGKLWAIEIFAEPIRCVECGRKVYTGYRKVTTADVVCPEHVERIEPPSLETHASPTT